MNIEPKISAMSIVLRGVYNPIIFHPLWFAANELIRKQEADAAKIEVLHPDVAQFSTEWLHLTATIDRLEITTSQRSYSEPLRDLALGVLELTHVPMTHLGLNRPLC